MQDLQFGMALENTNRAEKTTTQGGKWYFYNMNAKGFGQPEFRMKWGNRKLEDNWRRKNKQSMDFASTAVEDEESDSTSTEVVKILNNKSREFYLKDIPLTDSAMKVSHLRLEKALYNMGLVYVNELMDYDEAVFSFEEGLKRYPKGEYGVLSAYSLYELYNRQGPVERANYYKNYVINNFPESPRAKILSNPEYVQELLREQNRANIYYDETYKSYNAREYAKVIGNAENALVEFKGDKIIPKFKLLKALSIGKLEGNDRLTKELQMIVDEYPGNEVALYAADVIKLVYDISPDIAIADTEEKAEEIYNYEENISYFFGITSSQSADYNQLNFNLINFNLDNFDQLNLSIQTVDLGKNKLILVQSFKNLEEAKKYYMRYISDSENVYRDTNRDAVKVFLISMNNYQVLKEDTDLQKYYLYFRKYYQP